MHPASLHDRRVLVNVPRMRGLYLITRPLAGGTPALVRAVESAIAGGARMVQYRDKGGGESRRLDEVQALVRLCRGRSVPLIVNDDVALAKAANADGVHLGADDDDLESARRRLGGNALIGASCYNRLDLAVEAAARGADYVAFGSFFPSPTKPDAVKAGPALLREASRRIQLPVCAIGGITPANGGELIRAGADLLAVISGVFDADEPAAAAAEYARLFQGDDSKPEGRTSD